MLQRNNSLLLYLEFEHGTQFFLPDLQRADLRGQSPDRGVETLVLLLRDNTVTLVLLYKAAFYSSYFMFAAKLKTQE